MTIKERRYVEGGGSGGAWQMRVCILPDGEPLPPNAAQVPDETPVHEWSIDKGEAV